MADLLAGQLDKITKKSQTPTRRGKDPLDEIDRRGLEMATQSKKNHTHCTIDEAFVIQRMIKKHGQNWEKMHKDYRLNKF